MQLAEPIRVAVVEDESLFRELICSALAGMSGIEVVGSFSDAKTAAAGFPALTPDVALLDIDLGGGDSGIRLGAALKRAQPALALVFLSNHRDAAFVSAIAFGEAIGGSYLHKKSLGNMVALASAIRSAATGLVVLDPRFVAELGMAKPIAALSGSRSDEILGLLADGLSNAAIAQRIGLAEKSVESQLSQIYRQLGIDTSDPQLHARVCAAKAYAVRAPG